MTSRTRSDRCPGVFRPWIADDGALVRLRLAGAPLRRLHDLIDIAERWGDGAVHLTSRANVQIRGVSHDDGCVPAGFVEAITEVGLLPSPAHELIRNIEISPMSGRAAGRADVRPIAAELDRLLCSDPALAALPGRFLFVLDDGRGDVAWRPLDLGLVALDPASAQLRLGSEGWGPVVDVNGAAAALAGLAHEFIGAQGGGPDAPWHVDELDRPIGEAVDRDPRTRVSAEPWPPGIIEQRDGRVARHVPISDGRLDRAAAQPLPDEVLVTPWRSVIVPDQEPA